MGEDEIEPAFQFRSTVSSVARYEGRGEVRAEDGNVPLAEDWITVLEDCSAHARLRLGGHAFAEGRDQGA